jgi:hypothetical protein
VENSLFRAFVRFLEATLPLPNRSKLTKVFLPALKEEGSTTINKLLTGVRGVAITFDIWMSRKSENNMSVDIHFICNKWKWHHYHVGIFSCKDNLTSDDITPHIQRVLEEYDLMSRVVTNVKDGGVI